MSPLVLGALFLVVGLVVVIALFRLNRGSPSGDGSDPGVGGASPGDADHGEKHPASHDGGETSDGGRGHNGGGDSGGSGGDSGGGD